MLVFNPDDILIYTASLEPSEKPFPFLVSYQKDDRILCFVAADHSIDVASATHRLIDQAFADFKPQAVILEGMTTTSEKGWDQKVENFFVAEARKMRQRNSAIIGEPFYALLRARENGIAVFSGEPPEPFQRDYLIEAGYSADDFHAYNFLLTLVTERLQGLDAGTLPALWAHHRRHIPEALSENIESFYRWYEKTAGWSFELNRVNNLSIAPDATQRPGSLPHLAGTVSGLRDRTILKTIQKALEMYNRVLIIYGGSHYWTLKPALDKGFSL